MGLDITAYEQVTLVRATDSPTEELDSDNLVNFYAVPAFRGATDGMPEGLYSTSGKTVGFRAGSYMIWRRALADMIGIASLRQFWDTPRPGPFTELLNNADNEGFIGPETCAKLAKDFEYYRDTALRNLEPWAMDLYDQWAEAFKLAAGKGAVRLH